MIGSLLGCCACAASGHPAAPPRSLISSRRLMVSPAPRTESLTKEYHIFDRELRRLLDPSGPPLMSALGHKRTFFKWNATVGADQQRPALTATSAAARTTAVRAAVTQNERKRSRRCYSPSPPIRLCRAHPNVLCVHSRCAAKPLDNLNQK